MRVIKAKLIMTSSHKKKAYNVDRNVKSTMRRFTEAENQGQCSDQQIEGRRCTEDKLEASRKSIT